MRHWIGWTVPAALVALAAGCGGLEGIFLPTTVTVSLVNGSTQYEVDVVLFYHDEDDIPELLLTEVGTERTFTVPAGGRVSFSQDCDDLRAIMIDDADLRVLGGAGPETSSDVLRIDDDFECGSEIVFTFTHSAAILDFDVNVVVLPFASPFNLPAGG